MHFCETVFHLFWTCEHSRGFCQIFLFLLFILDNIHNTFSSHIKKVLFGLTNYEKDLEVPFPLQSYFSREISYSLLK